MVVALILPYSIAPICCGVQMIAVKRTLWGAESVECLSCGREN